MKINLRRIFCLLTVLSIGAAMLLVGCGTPGTAGESGNAPSPSASESVSAEPSPNPKEKKTISAQASSPVQGSWTEVDKYALDLDADKKKETVALFVNAQKDSKGELQKNDGQEWVLCVEAGGKYYTLFEEYVQNGAVYFDVSDYYIDDKTIPVITLMKSTGAEFKVFQYSYDKETAVFEAETIFDSGEHSKDGINRRYTSIPEVK